MIGRNVKHNGVGKRSGNDQGVTTGDGPLNQELCRNICALSDIQPGTVGQNVALRNAVMGNLDRVEHSRWKKRPTEPSKYSKYDDQCCCRNQNLQELPAATRPKLGYLHG